MGTRIVKDAATGRFFRLAHNNHEVQPMTFAEAVDDLNALVKSKRARAESVQQLSDDKDYLESNADDFDRAPRGRRRKDMREAWQGIQALDDDFDFLEADADMIHEMLVSGRPSKIRFPGAHGDSEIVPLDRQRYVEPDDEDEVSLGEGQGEGRSRIGGDKLSRRALRQGMDDDSYVRGKSLRRGLLDPRCFIKGSREFDLLKSKVQAAISDEQADPELGMILDSYDPRLTSARFNVIRCISNIPASVRRRYNIPSAPPAMESAFRGMRGSGQGMGF
jgi:hypothetical protein